MLLAKQIEKWILQKLTFVAHDIFRVLNIDEVHTLTHLWVKTLIFKYLYKD